jgi:hypothetical protein
VHGAFPQFPDWKDDMFADPPQHAWFEEIPSSLGAAYSICQPKERMIVIFELSSVGTDGPETNRL